MIYTITTNPSLDYYMQFDTAITINEHHRSIGESYSAGGKGVNVSIILNSLGINSSALGFLGGFTKDYYLSHLRQYPHIQPLFTSIKDNTRINVRINANDDTAFNAKGPTITKEEFEKFYLRLSKIYESDIVVVSGDMQDELIEPMYAVIKELSDNKVKIVLDTKIELVEKCLEFKPYLVKLNERTSSSNQDEIIAIAKSYVEKGAKYVIYSSSEDNNFYVFDKDNCLKVVSGKQNKAVGSGDSMIAGFIYGDIRGANIEELTRFAVASSTSVELSANITDKKEFDAIYKDLTLEKL